PYLRVGDAAHVTEDAADVSRTDAALVALGRPPDGSILGNPHRQGVSCRTADFAGVYARIAGTLPAYEVDCPGAGKTRVRFGGIHGFALGGSDDLRWAGSIARDAEYRQFLCLHYVSWRARDTGLDPCRIRKPTRQRAGQPRSHTGNPAGR